MKGNALTRRMQHACALHEQGDLQAAMRMYRELLIHAPDHVDLLFRLGTACLQSGLLAEAQTLLNRVLALQPRHCEAMSNLGLGLLQAGQVERAVPMLEQALALNPGFADAWNNYALALEHSGRLDAAESAYRRLIDLNPQRFEGPRHLGILLRRLGRYEESIQQLRRAMRLDPAQQADLMHEIGVALHEAGRLPEAVETLRNVLQMTPDSLVAHNTLAACLEELGLMSQALDEYAIAARLDPQNPLPRFNMAMPQLWAGNLADGWDLYELRWLQQPEARHPKYSQWQGESLAGKSILVYPEQGVGDEVLFASCLPDLIERAVHVGVLCDRRLTTLYARSFPGATIYGGREPGSETWSAKVADAYDFCVPIGSLPRYLRPRVEDFPARSGYLVADPDRVAFWRDWLDRQAGERRRVGLCWRSGLRAGVRHRFYPHIDDCRPLFEVPGIDWINLQYDECSADMQCARQQWHATVLEAPNLDLRNDLDEQAALISALESVVSAPTAVAELAAALGVPVLRMDRGWTSLGTDHMPWHPTMQVFPRRTAIEDRAPMMQAIAEALPASLVRCEDRAPIQPLDPAPARLVAAALRLMGAEDRQEALRLCRLALAQQPDTAEAWYLQGILLARDGDPAAAIGSLDHALAGLPLEAELYLARARVRVSLGDAQGVVQDLQMARALDPDCRDDDLALTSADLPTQAATDPGPALLAACRRAAESPTIDAGALRRHAQRLTESGHVAAAEILSRAALHRDRHELEPTEPANTPDTAPDAPTGTAPAWRLVSTAAGVLLDVAGPGAPQDGAEPIGFAHVQGLLPAGGTVLIAGSGDGLVTLASARAVGESGFVLVLEGRAEVAALLGASLVLNGLRHVVVESRDAADGSVQGLSPSATGYRSTGGGWQPAALERCDLLWIEHARPLQVLARLQELIGRCKPFVHVAGRSVDGALDAWLGANAYAYIGVTATGHDGRARSDLLLHPAG